MSSGVVVVNQPGVFFVDADGNVLSADDGTTISNHEGILIAGKDGTTLRFMRVAADGTLRIDPTGTTTQPVSAASLPLPTGAATEATLATLATETKLEAVRALLATIDTDTGNLDAALSTRASETKLEAVRLLLASLDAKDYATQTTLAAILVDTGQIETLLGTIDADTSFLAGVDYATQTTLAAVLVDTGQIEALLTTIDADTSILALVDYATAANQTNGSQKTQVVGGTGNVAVVNSSGQVAIQNPPNLNVPASTLATEATLALIKDTDGIKKITDQLPTGTNVIGKARLRSSTKGTSTEADLTSENVDANIEALHTDLEAWFGSTAPTVGQKVMDNSIPVTLANNQSALSITFTPANATTGVSSALIQLGGGSAGTYNVMRATAYVEPTSAGQRSIASSNANDTSAGTGARTVKLTYYDNTGVGPLTETLTLNGTARVVTTATNIRFIEKMEVITAGTSNNNEGTISLYTLPVGGTVIGSIGIGTIVAGIGDNQTIWCHHYVAVGQIAQVSVLIVGCQSGGSGTAGKFLVTADKPLIATSAELIIGGVLVVEGAFERSYTFNPALAGFARLTAYGIPGVNNALLAAAFDWSEVPI